MGRKKKVTFKATIREPKKVDIDFSSSASNKISFKATPRIPKEVKVDFFAKKWIQKAHAKKGALHRELGIPQTRTIPKAMLHKIVNSKVGSKVHGKTVTALMKRRANFALNAQKRRS